MRMGRNLRRSAGYVKMKAHVYRHTQKIPTVKYYQVSPIKPLMINFLYKKLFTIDFSWQKLFIINFHIINFNM